MLISLTARMTMPRRKGRKGEARLFDSLSSRGFAFALKPGFPSDEERKEEPIKACFRPVQKTVESVRSRG